jgi:hypothetical protein
MKFYSFVDRHENNVTFAEELRTLNTKKDASGLSPSPEALTALIMLHNICSHPQLVKQDSELKPKVFDIEVSGEFAVLEALLQQIQNIEPMDKVFIVSNFTSKIFEAMLGNQHLTSLPKPNFDCTL